MLLVGHGHVLTSTGNETSRPLVLIESQIHDRAYRCASWWKVYSYTFRNVGTIMVIFLVNPGSLGLKIPQMPDIFVQRSLLVVVQRRFSAPREASRVNGRTCSISKLISFHFGSSIKIPFHHFSNSFCKHTTRTRSLTPGWGSEECWGVLWVKGYSIMTPDCARFTRVDQSLFIIQGFKCVLKPIFTTLRWRKINIKICDCIPNTSGLMIFTTPPSNSEWIIKAPGTKDEEHMIIIKKNVIRKRFFKHVNSTFFAFYLLICARFCFGIPAASDCYCTFLGQ